MTATALLLASFLPVDGVARETVQVIEVNCLYDCQARLTLCQIIFWGSNGRVIAWRLNNERRLDPVANVSWFIDDGKVRCIRGRTVVETHLQHDPELDDREILPASERRGLRK